MVARFDYCCKECGSNTFVASGVANDDPVGDSGDEMRSTLRVHCSQCSELAVELKTRMDGNNELTQNLSTFRAPWDPKRIAPYCRAPCEYSRAVGGGSGVWVFETARR